jgi:hypothetical protein
VRAVTTVALQVIVEVREVDERQIRPVTVEHPSRGGRDPG